VLPQPSGIVPQSLPSAAQVVGVHPHWFAVPSPPQVAGAAHVPQSRVFPQWSSTLPHSFDCAAHVTGLQTLDPPLPPDPAAAPVPALESLEPQAPLPSPSSAVPKTIEMTEAVRHELFIAVLLRLEEAACMPV
jgi:hypothetical protein